MINDRRGDLRLWIHRWLGGRDFERVGQVESSRLINPIFGIRKVKNLLAIDVSLFHAGVDAEWSSRKDNKVSILARFQRADAIVEIQSGRPVAIVYPDQREGQLELRLPDGASPYYLAFGEMAEAHLPLLAADGTRLGTIVAPRHAHNMAWGGEDGQTLYLCARDRLYRMRLNVAGAPRTERVTRMER